jgi:hypothetical protein
MVGKPPSESTTYNEAYNSSENSVHCIFFEPNLIVHLRFQMAVYWIVRFGRVAVPMVHSASLPGWIASDVHTPVNRLRPPRGQQRRKSVRLRSLRQFAQWRPESPRLHR